MAAALGEANAPPVAAPEEEETPRFCVGELVEVKPRTFPGINKAGGTGTITKVNDERSNIGALQNRFEYTSSNLMNSIQNNSASLSTIQDADFAVEAADLARNQILTQSSSAMLAQANQISQNVMGLLR